MTIHWSAYRRARRRSRQAWALLSVLILGIVCVIGWFFTAGQFSIAEPRVNGPSEAPVLDRDWMKPVAPVQPVPAGSAAGALEQLPVKGRAPKNDYDRSAF